jgi:hypothetical protein
MLMRMLRGDPPTHRHCHSPEIGILFATICFVMKCRANLQDATGHRWAADQERDWPRLYSRQVARAPITAPLALRAHGDGRGHDRGDGHDDGARVCARGNDRARGHGLARDDAAAAAGGGRAGLR